MKISTWSKNLNSAEDFLNYALQLRAESEKLAGENSEQSSEDLTSYLPWASCKTDRHLVNLINIEIEGPAEPEKILELLKEKDRELYTLYLKEKPIYDMIEFGLKGKLTTMRFFFNEDWHSRKLCFTDSEECLSLIKLIVDADEMDLITFLRSMNRKKLPCDLIGMYVVMSHLIEQYKEINPQPLQRKSLLFVVSDYQHVIL